jgi:hypothetical protein
MNKKGHATPRNFIITSSSNTLHLGATSTSQGSAETQSHLQNVSMFKEKNFNPEVYACRSSQECSFGPIDFKKGGTLSKHVSSTPSKP